MKKTSIEKSEKLLYENVIMLLFFGDPAEICADSMQQWLVCNVIWQKHGFSLELNNKNFFFFLGQATEANHWL